MTDSSQRLHNTMSTLFMNMCTSFSSLFCMEQKKIDIILDVYHLSVDVGFKYSFDWIYRKLVETKWRQFSPPPPKWIRAKNKRKVLNCDMRWTKYVLRQEQSVYYFIDLNACIWQNFCNFLQCVRFLLQFRFTIETNLIAFIAPIIGYYFIFEGIIWSCFWY